MSDDRYYGCAACGGINRIPVARVEEAPHCGRCGAELALQGMAYEVDDDRARAWIAKAPIPVLVDFWAPWCGPCRAFAPTLKKFAEKHAGRFLILKIDTDQHGALAQAVGVQGIPTLGLWRGGERVAVSSGAMSMVQLQGWVEQSLAQAAG